MRAFLQNGGGWGRRVTFVLLLTLVFALGTIIGGQTHIGSAQGDDIESFLAPIGQLYTILQGQFYQGIDDETMLNAALEGIMESLDDRHSVYIEPDIFAITANDLSGELQGIGARVQAEEESGDIRIVSVLKGTPAEDAGLRGGDIFRSVDGVDVSTLNQMELVIKVRGPAGTTVNLTMQRGEDLLDFVVKRARIILDSVESEQLDDGIGYIRLLDFSSKAATQLTDTLLEMDAQFLDALVLDLRDNPGGLLQAALDITSLFLPPGEIILHEVFTDREEIFRAQGQYAGLNIPIAILVNENSASASELLSAALRENGIATIIGETTFGKGSVQSQIQLANGGGVRYTIAEWLTPERNSIEGNGVQPDILVEWDALEAADDEADPQLEAAIRYLLRRLRKAA